MANNIEKYRKQKNLTQSELARRVGVTRSHINKIENGKLNGSIPLMVKIAKELDVSLNEIFFK